jgi:hypothetical protein
MQMKKKKVKSKVGKKKPKIIEEVFYLSKPKQHPYMLGAAYLIRTVTMYYTGVIKEVYEHELVLSNAAWIADTGRYHDALKTGVFKEVEPINKDAIIGRGAIIDCVEWLHELPTIQK